MPRTRSKGENANDKNNSKAKEESSSTMEQQKDQPQTPKKAGGGRGRKPKAGTAAAAAAAASQPEPASSQSSSSSSSDVKENVAMEAKEMDQAHRGVEGMQEGLGKGMEGGDKESEMMKKKDDEGKDLHDMGRGGVGMIGQPVASEMGGMENKDKEGGVEGGKLQHAEEGLMGAGGGAGRSVGGEGAAVALPKEGEKGDGGMKMMEEDSLLKKRSGQEMLGDSGKAEDGGAAKHQKTGEHMMGPGQGLMEGAGAGGVMAGSSDKQEE